MDVIDSVLPEQHEHVGLRELLVQEQRWVSEEGLCE